MKNVVPIITKKFLLSLSLMIFSVAVSQDFNCPINSCIDFANNTSEDKINLDGYFKTMNQVTEENDRFMTCMKYDAGDGTGQKPLSNIALPVQMKAIVCLYKSILNNTPCIKISGVKIHFGLEGNTVVLIFQPIIMRNPYRNYFWEDYSYTIAHEGAYYKYNTVNGLFGEISTSQKNTLTTRYIDQIRIIHSGTTNPAEPINLNSGSWQRDTWCVIFSFRELFDLYESNKTCPDANGNYYQETIYFYNGVAEYDRFLGLVDRNKHTLLASILTLDDLNKFTKNDGKVKLGKLVIGLPAANMAHLCPPSCDPAFNVLKWGSNCP